MRRNIHKYFLILALGLSLNSMAYSADSPELLQLREKVKPVFKKNCYDCHNWKTADDYEVFETTGLPRKQKIQTVKDLTHSEPDADRHMPPDVMLSAADLAVVASWVTAETSTFVVAAISCQWVDHLEAGSGNALVTDAEAAEIMGRSCSQCHGKASEMSPMQLAGGFIAASAGTYSALRAWQRHKLGKSEFAAANCNVLSRLTNPWVLAGIAALSGGAAVFPTLLKLPHTSFLHQDGSFASAALAGKDESLSRIINLVVGIDGKEFMPPATVPSFAVGHYTPQDKEKLSKWLRQQMDENLPQGCQASFFKDHGEIRSMPYARASETCSKLGARLPTLGQLERLVPTIPMELTYKCVWSSTFSEDRTAPRLSWEFGGKGSDIEVKAQREEMNCLAVCLK